MRIRGLYIIFATLLFVILGLLGYAGAKSTPWLFYTIEGMIILVFVYLIVFYNKIIKPLRTIGNGMELLNAQDFSSRLSRVGEFEADKVVDIFNRMMEQLKDERLRLREQNHFLDLLIKASPMGVIIVSLDDEITETNPMALQLLNVPVIEGTKLSALNSPLAAELATIPRGESKAVRLGDANTYKCTHSSFINKGFPQSFYLIESLTDEVMKAEKKAYEKVIRMIAHEVNNTTAGISSTLDSLNDALAEIDNTEDISEVMQVCIDRCYSMSQFITRFADVVKIPEPHTTQTNLNELVLTCIRFMEQMCRERNITIALQAEASPIVMLDASLFEQVFVNIIKNSIESIGCNGNIIIRTTAQPSVEFIDNGKGISKAVEEKLFSPFFSTKPNGQGIGLIFIREVLIQHDCAFSLRTYSDGLTKFCITFPK
ncbi:PAS domain-containing sensor histidine kinase [Bacteroides sp. 214]|uniref:sensor histidine kinase n=1 Tax=Bacteroides sp. 214 TaxID=2302935 RepID=UPI0013D7AE38|nr:ATP-binding protein [Bacteroides sp. 214]NDW12427.1 PAS domain-containing sensor histidine kinase [Bacteroides sp. 214]